MKHRKHNKHAKRRRNQIHYAIHEENPVATQDIGGPFGELPSELRLALENFVQYYNEANGTYLKPEELILRCQVRPAYRKTHEDLGPRLPRSHDRDPLEMSCRPSFKDDLIDSIPWSVGKPRDEND